MKIIKVIRTANINILETAMLGGLIDYSGNRCESDHSFTWYNDHLKKNGYFNVDLIREHVLFFIEEYGDRIFKYYDENYKFKTPNHNNLLILSNRMTKRIAELEAEKTVS